MVANCSILCPALTVVTHDGAHFTCSYTEWAYGLAAALICVGGLLPIALLICFWVKLKNSAVKRKGKFRRQDSEASTFTDVSRPHDHGVYEVYFLYQLFFNLAILTMVVLRCCVIVVKRNTGVVSSNPARVTIKTPLARKSTGNHLIKSTSLEKAQSPVSGFCHT